MIPVRGLSYEEISLQKQALSARHGVYFSAMMMCMWDNIHGPRVLKVWTGDEPLPMIQPHKDGDKLAELRKVGEIVAVQIEPGKLTKEIKEQLVDSEFYT